MALMPKYPKMINIAIHFSCRSGVVRILSSRATNAGTSP